MLSVIHKCMCIYKYDHHQCFSEYHHCKLSASTERPSLCTMHIKHAQSQLLQFQSQTTTANHRSPRKCLTSTQTQHQVQCALLLDVVIRQSAAILKLLASKDQTLLVRWDALLVLNLLLHVVNSVRWLNIKSDGLASQSCSVQ
jgi:hypothetical protein